VLVYQLLMVILNAAVFYTAVNNSTRPKPAAKFIAAIISLFHIRLGYVFFLSGYTFHQKKMAFAVVKFFSIALLSVSFVLNRDHFDLDFFIIFFQLIAMGHAMLVFHYVSFIELQLGISRNLPLPLYKVAHGYILTYAIILLPELLFMLINNQGNLPVVNIIIFYLVLAAALFLFTAVLYADGLDMDRYLLFVFAIFITLFFCMKSGMYLATLATVSLAAAAVFRAHYHCFEKSNV
jgi:hypothetical protein